MPKIVQRKSKIIGIVGSRRRATVDDQRLLTEVRVPTKGTLRRYGLTVEQWIEILSSQGNVCAICRKVPPSGIWVTDHDHVPKFKRMLPEHRSLYVRGILCSWCNSHFVHRSMTVEKAKNVAVYLTRYNKRKPTELHKPVKKKRVKRSTRLG